MAEQELTSLKITLSSDIKQGDINKANKLADVFDRLDKIKVNNQLPSYLQKMATAMQGFKGVTIGASFNKSITNLTETLNNITSINDITPHAENLKTGFRALSEATSGFNGVNIKIPVGLGKGITGIIEATNKITEVKDIGQYANTLVKNFNTISQATRSFDGMKSADYTGISRLITAMTSINKIKPINNTVVDNAKKLAEAINTLDKNTNVSTLRLHQLAGAAKATGVSFNSSTKSVKGFGGSLKLVNFALVIQGMRKMINLSKKLVIELLSFVKAYGQVQNTMSFFTNSMGDQAAGAAHLIQQYANFGAVDFTDFADQTAKLNQMYKGYGISAENAAKMALNMTQLAYDASYALGQNGEDIALWNQRATSFATGQTRSGYFFGVDASVKALAEEFEGLTNQTDKATRAMASYEVLLKNTVAIQGQLPREFQNSYVQMQVFQNRLVQLKQSIGQALVPAFQTIIQWGLVALKVVERIIGAIARLFGADFKLIDYGQMIEDMGSGGMSGVADSTQAVADGMSDATNNAKELKKTISGIDQVFTINDEKPSTSGSGGSGAGGVGGIGGAVSGYDWLDDLATIGNIEALQKVDEAADKIVASIQKGLPFVVAFGAGLLAWKISKSFLNNLKWIQGLKDIGGNIGLDKITFGVGFALLIDNLIKFKDAVADFIKDGPNFDNVSRMISSFAGVLGSVMLMTGNVKIAGVLFVVQGVVEIVNAIYDMKVDGINWGNISKAIDGLAGIAIGVGLLTGNWAAVGVGLAVKGIVGLIENIGQVLTAIKTGDWSGVDKIGMFKNALLVAAGAVSSLKIFNKAIGKKGLAPVLEETATSSAKITKIKMPSWASVAKVFAIVAAGLALVISAIWLIGKINTNTLEKSLTNTKLIGKAFGNIIIPLTLLLTVAGALGFVVSKNIVSWADIAVGLLAIDVGIVNMIAMVSLASKWETSKIEKGKRNMTLVGDAFKAIEIPLSLLLVKAGVIGLIITSSMGIGALVLAAGIIAINATIVDMLAMTKLASEWKTSELEKGKKNITLAADSFNTLEKPLSNLLSMVDSIGKNMSLYSWLTGKSYDFNKALGQLKSTMDALISWIGSYKDWDTNELIRGGEAIDLAGKAGAIIVDTLKPLLDMIESIGKHTNNMFGIGNYDYDGALAILQGTMNSLLTWIGKYKDWKTDELVRGGEVIRLAGEAGAIVNTTLAPLLEMMNSIGKKTNNMFGIGDYDYDNALSILQSVMNSMIKWLMRFKVWQVDELRVGASVMEIASTPLSTINKALGDLIPLLDNVGKQTYGVNGVGGYSYDSSLKTLQGIMYSMIHWIGDTFSKWDIPALTTGASVLELSSAPLSVINDSFTELLPLLDSVGKRTNNFLGIGDYNYEKSMGVITKSMKSIVDAVSSLGKSTTVASVDAGIVVINKTKDVISNLSGFNTTKTSGLESAAKNFVSFSKEIKKAFEQLQATKTSNVESIMKALNSIELSKFRGIGTSIVKEMELGINNYVFGFATTTNKIKNGLTFSASSIGSGIASTLSSGINSSYVNVNTFTNRIKSALNVNSKSIGTNIASSVVSGINSSYVNVATFTNKIKSALNINLRSTGSSISTSVVSGINSGSVNVATFTNRIKSALNVNSRAAGSGIASSVVSGINSGSTNVATFTNRIKSNLNVSTYQIGRDIAWGVQNGINSFYPNLTTFTNRLKTGMRVSFEVRSPSRWARDVIGAMIGKGVEIGVNNTEVNLNPFKRNISEGMYDIIDSLDVQPTISTPSFDTSKLNGDIKGATQALNTQVLSKLDVTNDGTERAIAHLTDATVELLTEVVDAVKQGKDIVLDGEKISKNVSRSMRNAEINNNTIF